MPNLMRNKRVRNVNVETLVFLDVPTFTFASLFKQSISTTSMFRFVASSPIRRAMLSAFPLTDPNPIIICSGDKHDFMFGEGMSETSYLAPKKKKLRLLSSQQAEEGKMMWVSNLVSHLFLALQNLIYCRPQTLQPRLDGNVQTDELNEHQPRKKKKEKKTLSSHLRRRARKICWRQPKWRSLSEE